MPIADRVATSASIGWPSSGSVFRRSMTRNFSRRWLRSSPMKPSSSPLVGSCPFKSRKAPSSKLECSASCSTLYPRYDRVPAWPSILQTLERAAGTPARPGTYSTAMGPSSELRPRKHSPFPSVAARMPVVKEKGSTSEAPRALPPLDFSTLILSMASTAMVQLGVVHGPGGDIPAPDLDAAKQAIDILAILEEKTRGNLDDAEEKLLQSLLYDLRVAYVDAQKKQKR